MTTSHSKQYKVFYWANGSPGYFILYANCEEDAKKKADIHPSLIYDVWLLDDWIDECEKRKGNYQTK